MRSTTGVRLDDPSHDGAAEQSRSLVSSHISGIVESGEIRNNVELAIAVNGTIEALTRPFWDGGVQRFRAMIPEQAVRAGSNRVDVFAVKSQRRRTRIVWIGTSRWPPPTTGR